MTKKIWAFLEQIAHASPSLEEAYREIRADWAPESPPITVAFGTVGGKLADAFDALDLPARTRVFDLIEEGMEADDEALSTAIATGLVEAFAAGAVRRGSWNNIKGELRTLSRSHAEAWIGE